MHCPGSIRVIRSMPAPPPPSVWAVRGTAMHLAAAEWLTTQLEPDWTKAYVGCILDDDEIDAVKLYVMAVWEDQREFGGELIIEKKFSLASLREGMFGTCDAVLIKCKDHVLRVYDLKGGVGVLVEVEGNSQAMYYGYGAVLSAKAGPITALELVIVQPRARHPDGPVRRWRVDLIDAYDWSHDLLAAAERTDDPEAPLQGGHWCRFCPAAGNCTAHRDWQLEEAARVFSEPGVLHLPDPALMSNAELGALLPVLEAIKDYRGIVYAYCHAEAERGRDVPGWKLIAKRSRRKWNGDDRDIIAGLHGLGLTEAQIFETSLRSPAQVEKTMPRGERDKLKELYVSKSSGTSLVPESDSHPAVPGTGLSVFEPLPEGDAA